MNKNKLWDMLMKFVFIALLIMPTIVSAVDINTEISDAEKAQFDDILVPVMKIYNFIKYSVSVIAVIALLFAGISYMTSGSDPKKRDNAKGIATYVLIGLIIIWAAPYAVNILVS